MSAQGDLFGFRAPLDVVAQNLLGISLWLWIRGRKSFRHAEEMANRAAAAARAQA